MNTITPNNASNQNQDTNEKITNVEAEETNDNAGKNAIEIGDLAVNTKKNIEQTFAIAQKKNRLEDLGSPEKEAELRAVAKDIVASALEDGPNGMKKRMEIKNIWVDRPKSKLLLKKIWDLRSKVSEWTSKSTEQLLEINWTIEKKFWKVIKWKFGVIRSIAKWVPLFGKKIDAHLLNQESLADFSDGITKILEDVNKELLDQSTELEVQKQYLQADATALREQFFLAKYVAEEISNQIILIWDGSTSNDNMIQIDELNKNLLAPVLQKASAIWERIVVDIGAYMQFNQLQASWENLQIAVNKTIEVTLHALNNVMTSEVALVKQEETQAGIEATNALTSKMIEHTGERIHIASVQMAKATMKSSTDINSIKKSMNEIQKAVDECNQVYRDSMPWLQKAIGELDELVDQWMKTLGETDQANKKKGKISKDLNI